MHLTVEGESICVVLSRQCLRWLYTQIMAADAALNLNLDIQSTGKLPLLLK